MADEDPRTLRYYVWRREGVLYGRLQPGGKLVSKVSNHLGVLDAVYLAVIGNPEH
jgi:hypothetical protein